MLSLNNVSPGTTNREPRPCHSANGKAMGYSWQSLLRSPMAEEPAGDGRVELGWTHSGLWGSPGYSTCQPIVSPRQQERGGGGWGVSIAPSPAWRRWCSVTPFREMGEVCGRDVVMRGQTKTFPSNGQINSHPWSQLTKLFVLLEEIMMPKNLIMDNFKNPPLDVFCV